MKKIITAKVINSECNQKNHKNSDTYVNDKKISKSTIRREKNN